MNKRILTALMAISFLANAGVFSQVSDKYRSKDIYEYSRQIADTAKDKIWPGYDFRSYTRVAADPAGDYLSFSSDPESKAPDAFQWKLVDGFFLDHSLDDDLVIAFHEAFHGFERDHRRRGGKWGAENSMLIFEYQESSARAGALFRMESSALRLALESRDKNILREKVREFLAIRHLRQSEIDPRFVEFEKGAELNEGLAEYAGVRAVIAGMDAARQKMISVPFAETTAEAYLSKKYEMLDSITKVGQNIRRKFYYTGSAQGFLLDRITPGWKDKVQMEGASLQDLLAAAAGKPLNQKEVNSALSEGGYVKILADEQAAVTGREAKNRALLENTLGQKGRRYVIDYSALGAGAGIRNFDPMNVTMITPKVRVHTRSVTFAADNLFTATFLQPVVEDLSERQYTTIVPEGQGESLKIDGVDTPLTKSLEKTFANGLSITSPAFNFEAKTGTVKIADGEVRITLTGK